jgi:hypothetical protein
VHLGERTFSRLDDADAVLGVANGDLQATDLAAQALADGQTGGVVGGPVDAEAGRQLLERLGHLPVGDRQVPVGVHRRDVLVDAETHGFLLEGSDPGPVFPSVGAGSIVVSTLRPRA